VIRRGRRRVCGADAPDESVVFEVVQKACEQADERRLAVCFFGTGGKGEVVGEGTGC